MPPTAAHVKYLLESTIDQIWLLDNSLNLILFNANFLETLEQQLGVTPEVGSSFISFFSDPNQLARWERLLKRALNGEVVKTSLLHGEMGTELPSQLVLHPIKEDEKVVAVRCSNRDIDDLARRSIKIADSNKELSDFLHFREIILNTMGEGVVVVDMQGNFKVFT